MAARPVRAVLIAARTRGRAVSGHISGHITLSCPSSVCLAPPGRRPRTTPVSAKLTRIREARSRPRARARPSARTPMYKPTHSPHGATPRPPPIVGTSASPHSPHVGRPQGRAPRAESGRSAPYMALSRLPRNPHQALRSMPVTLAFRSRVASARAFTLSPGLHSVRRTTESVLPGGS
ncbi:hypothetical protein C8Q77DRAFT_456493 [Trametes polyzona]|nr:hypothetical protein C8Q77DRAFT_456493 [Trametes polyzona]